MRLNLERLILTSLAHNDFAEIHAMNAYTQVAEYNTIGIPKNISETTIRLEKVIADDRALVWVIRKKERGAFVGEIGMNLSSKKYRKGEIYYNLHPDCWGEGLATEAVKAIINFGFTELGLHRIEAGVATENIRSIALLERIGLAREGLCRKILPLQSGWKDNYMYAILAEDLREY